MKVLVIGIDGATFNIIKPLVREGRLRTFGKLMKEGVYEELLSVFPPVTYPAWTSFKTGKNPGKHGVFGFLRATPHLYLHSFYRLARVQQEAFWEILSKEGFKVGIINVPTTYPPSRINGVMISGSLDTPHLRAPFVYPTGVRKILEALEYKPDIREYRKGEEKEWLSYLKEATIALTRISCYLLEHFDFDFFMVNFMIADLVQHRFWGEDLVVSEVYEIIDEQIAHILSCVKGSTNVFVVSDHGAGPCFKEVYMDEWLEREGFLKRRETKKFFSPNSIAPLRTPLKQKNDKIFTLFKKLLLKLTTRSFLLRKFALNFVTRVGEIDLRATKVYSGGYFGKLYLNHEAIKKEEREHFIRELRDRLFELKDPESNERIVDRIYEKEEIYSGKFIDIAPDLTIILKGMSYVDYPGFREGKIFYPPRQKGDHRLEGVFIASGPDIRTLITKPNENRLRIYDIAPTILHMFGLPIPDDMDGRVLTEIFREDSEPARRPVRYIKVSEERERIKDRIERLRRERRL